MCRFRGVGQVSNNYIRLGLLILYLRFVQLCHFRLCYYCLIIFFRIKTFYRIKPRILKMISLVLQLQDADEDTLQKPQCSYTVER